MNIEHISYYVSLAAFAVVVACWFVFAGVFLLRKRPQAAKETVKAPRSWVGLALQGLGYAFVLSLRRSGGTVFEILVFQFFSERIRPCEFELIDKSRHHRFRIYRDIQRITCYPAKLRHRAVADQFTYLCLVGR